MKKHILLTTIFLSLFGASAHARELEPVNCEDVEDFKVFEAAYDKAMETGGDLVCMGKKSAIAKASSAEMTVCKKENLKLAQIEFKKGNLTKAHRLLSDVSGDSRCSQRDQELAKKSMQVLYKEDLARTLNLRPKQRADYSNGGTGDKAKNVAPN